MDQAPPLLLAVALYDPAVTTFLSSVMLPCEVARAAYPLPAAVTVFAETPAPNSMSVALVVTADPLFREPELPMADDVTSTGCDRSIPEYS
jgi:hypothetical protein